LKQLISILTGIDEETARAVISPTDGLPGKYPKLTAFNLNKWLEARARRRSPTVARTAPEEDNWSPPTEEEKRRSMDALRRFKAGLVLDEPKKHGAVKPTGHHDPEALIKALERRNG
jgi:hypothetical protein